MRMDTTYVRVDTEANADNPRIFPSIHCCGETAEMICSVTRSCFSPVIVMNWYAKLTKMPRSINPMITPAAIFSARPAGRSA